MAMESTWCPVLQSYVTRVTDPAGWVAGVFFPELDRSRHACRMKQESFRYGAFQTLFPPSADDSVAELVTRCPMA